MQVKTEKQTTKSEKEQEERHERDEKGSADLLSSSSRLLTSAPHSRRMEATVREGNLQTG